MSRDLSLRIDSLAKTFRTRRRGGETVHALRGVSFELVAGDAVALVGESGSGKSTLARIVMGLETATGGTVLLDGLTYRRGRAQTAARARRMQMVFQNPYSSLDPTQTVGAAIAEVLRFHLSLDARERDARVQELLCDVGLDPSHAASRPNALSGGQRQRVAIARALAADPDLLVLDEAVSALDVSVQAQILNLLNAIRAERNLAFLFITHDLGVVRQVCDTVHVMRNGEIVESGAVDAVLDTPQHPYTRMLMDAVPGPGWDPHAVVERERSTAPADRAPA
ncbi:ABC transporter ATP-binding protein [Leifsonia aquatica]|uniref:ABC transporter ATP-binding protein n=1 Tax=Leifsonia aquatica TaxID=144185 RepID=UPI00046A8DFA|nr:ATP-binding cassette domain-containing protein [Leifsonia aquatica]